MAAPRQRRSWSGWNECGRDDLAVRQLPRRIFSGAVALSALSRRKIRNRSRARGGGRGSLRHPPHDRAGELAAAPDRQRADLWGPAYDGRPARRFRPRRRHRVVRGRHRAVRAGEAIRTPQLKNGLSCPAKAGHPVMVVSVITRSPALAGDDGHALARRFLPLGGLIDRVLKLVALRLGTVAGWI